MTRGTKKNTRQKVPDEGAISSADQGTMEASNPGERLEELAGLIKSCPVSGSQRPQDQFQQLLSTSDMRQDYRQVPEGERCQESTVDVDSVEGSSQRDDNRP